MHELLCGLVLTGSVLCLQASLLQCIQALTSLLDSTLAESEQQPQQPLPALAVTFAATQVQVSAFLLPFKYTFLPACCHSSTRFCLLAATKAPTVCWGTLYFFLHGLAADLCTTSLRASCGFRQVLVFVQDCSIATQRTLSLTAQSGAIQESGVGVSAARTSDDVQAAYSALLEQALSHLQLLGVEAASAKHSKKKAQERLYALLEALAKVSIQYWQCQRQVCLLTVLAVHLAVLGSRTPRCVWCLCLLLMSKKCML